MESTPLMSVTNAWQFRQILGRGAHGILLCRRRPPTRCAPSWNPAAIRTTRSASIPTSPRRWQRMAGAVRPKDGGIDSTGRKQLGIGTRGRGSETTAAPCWACRPRNIWRAAIPGRSIRRVNYCFGVKLESPEGVANCEEILAVPGLDLRRSVRGDPQSLARLHHDPARAVPAGNAGGARPYPGGVPQQWRRLPAGLHA